MNIITLIKGGISLVKTAIVTGASSGIGKAIAKKLSLEGFNVVLVARREEILKKLAAGINEQKKGIALAVMADISQRKEVEFLIGKASDYFGSIDIVVNNAGLMLNGRVTEGEVMDWEKMIDVNVKGLLYCTHGVLPEMIDKGSGHIVNIASVSGFEVTKRSTVYSATKFAVRAISTGLEKELARTGVRVTNISPGMVDTELSSRVSTGRKILQPEDIANAVYFALTQPDYVNVNEVTVRPV